MNTALSLLQSAAGILAQDAVPAPAAEGVPQGNPFQPLGLLAVGGVLFYFMVMRPQQRQQQEREDVLGGLKKHDKVVTAGGIIGTITDLSNDGQQVTLKVDDGTRIKFLKSSIQRSLEETPPATDEDKK